MLIEQKDIECVCGTRKAPLQKPHDMNLVSGISLVYFTAEIICLFYYYPHITPRSPK